MRTTRRFIRSPERSELETDTDYLFLREDIDYLFCAVCRVHVPCRRLEAGGWEVRCAGCQGECASCCYLKQFFGSRDQFPPLLPAVADPEKE